MPGLLRLAASGGRNDDEPFPGAHEGGPSLRLRLGNAGLGDSDTNMNRPHDSRPDTPHLHRVRSTAVPGSGVSHDSGVRRIPSAELFASGVLVEIEHDGEIYRLRHTRRGKLILTK